MSIETVITSTVIKSTTELLFNYLKKVRLPLPDQEADLSFHLKEIEAWSARIQIFEMPGALDTSKRTIGLEISNAPRRFSQAFVPTETIDELGLLRSGRHVVLLGDPGSGKTTTIKRIVRHMLTEEGDECSLNYPIRLILRDLESDANIYVILAGCLGLRIDRIESKKKDGTLDISYVVGGKPIENAVSEVLEGTGALILLDGLDEVDDRLRAYLVGALGTMASRLHRAQILVTCRSGDYNASIDGFDVLEIVPLSDSQIAEISGKTLSDPTRFLEAMLNVPYRDLANRPLFLIYLMIIFEDRKRLPERAVDVYRRFMLLALEEWDRRRGLVRRSVYSQFEAEAKVDFLALLAYSVTYEGGSKSFTREKFEGFYEKNYERFNLPKNESTLVAHEIESHTGIIVDISRDRFEFSHLSIQEYLCAYHIVREPHSEMLGSYLEAYPAPVAIATALSSNANAWLANLLLHRNRMDGEIKLVTLLDRIVLEKPNFFISEELGLVAMFVVDSISRRRIIDPDAPLTDILERLMESRVWRASLAAATPRYNLDLDGFSGREVSVPIRSLETFETKQYSIDTKLYVVMRNRVEYRGDYHIKRVDTALLPRGWFEDIVREFRPYVTAMGASGPPMQLDIDLYFPA